MDDDTRGAGIELADTPEVKEASALALEAISEHYESNGHEIGADVDAAHIIALAIAAGQFKANQRAEKAERALAVANGTIAELCADMGSSRIHEPRLPR